jgi:TP901 family phage tail tape measure protein
MELFSLMGTVAINKDPVLKDLKDIQDQAQKTATAMGGSFEKAGKFITDHSAQFKAVGKAMTVVGGIITAVLTAIIYKTVEAEDEFGDMSERIGESVENLSALSYVAKMSETNIETLELSLKFLTRAIYDTSKGTGTAKDIFKELGISVSDTEGKLRPMIDVLKDAATKIAAIEDPTKQAALAMELFGSRTGPQLLPMLKMGGAGIDELMRKAKELGLVISTEDAAAADKFDKSMITLKASLAATGRDIAHVLMPPLLEFMNKATEIVKKVREWIEENPQLTRTLTYLVAGLGGVMVILGPMVMMLPSLVAGFKLMKPTIDLVTGSMKASETGLISFNAVLLLGIANIIIWTKVWEEWKKAISGKSLKELNEDLESAEENLAKLQEETAKKFGITIEKYQELLKAGVGAREMLNLGKNAPDWPAYNKGLDELTKLFESGEYSAQVFYKALRDLEIETRVTRVATDKNAEAMQAATDNTANLKDEIQLLSEAYELDQKYLSENNKSVKDTIMYHRDLIMKYEELQSTLRNQLMLLKEGTDEYKKKEEEIKNVNKSLWEERTALEALTAPLTGLDLIASQMNLLGDSAVDQQVKLYLLGTTAERLKDKLKDAFSAPAVYGDLQKQIEENVKQMEALRESIRDTQLSDLNAQLGYIQTKFEQGKPSIEGYKMEIEILGDTLKLLQDRLKEEKPGSAAYIEIQTQIDTTKESINLLNKAIDAVIFNKEPLTEALSAMGLGFTGITTEIGEARTAMAEFAKLAINTAKEVTVAINEIQEATTPVAPTISIPVLTPEQKATTEAYIKETYPQAKPVGSYQEGGLITTFLKAMKRLAGGGSTDTVPIWATPGEYLIKKQMVDFIKRTGMVTGGLVEAIRKGLPTPSPEFAGGGVVGNWGISHGSSALATEGNLGRKGSWVYSPNISVIVQGDGDVEKIKRVVNEALIESADAFDISGFEVGV